MRCLIVEKHVWETGGGGYQVQIPLDAAQEFFGTGDVPKQITVKIISSGNAVGQYNCSVSRTYKNGTRRINGLPILGSLGQCFIFFQETSHAGVYELWWNPDVAYVASKHPGWRQGRDSKYGRGRLVNIVDARLRP